MSSGNHIIHTNKRHRRAVVCPVVLCQTLLFLWLTRLYLIILSPQHIHSFPFRPSLSQTKHSVYWRLQPRQFLSNHLLYQTPPTSPMQHSTFLLQLKQDQTEWVSYGVAAPSCPPSLTHHHLTPPWQPCTQLFQCTHTKLMLVCKTASHIVFSCCIQEGWFIPSA